MLGICFHHEQFDADISSGTLYSIDQWSNLFTAFGVKNIAVINQTADILPPFCNTSTTRVFSSIDLFLDNTEGNIVNANPRGSIHYREVNYKKIDWLVFGASGGNNFDGGVIIPTRDNRELYPREAAAIMLSEASWQLH